MKSLFKHTLSLLFVIIICLMLIIPLIVLLNNKHNEIRKKILSNLKKNPCKDTLTDREYLDHMIPHHEVAVYMSEQLLDKTKNPIILNILRNIIRVQTYEIAMMKDYIVNNKMDDDMSNINIKMNTKYYKTQGDFTDPNTLEISETYCDPSFFHITNHLHDMSDKGYMEHMIPHHQVAIDMSKRILKSSKNDFIIYMAYRIIRSQQTEITELTNLLNSPYMFNSLIV